MAVPDGTPEQLIDALLERLRAAGDAPTAAAELAAVATDRLLGAAGGKDHLAHVLSHNPLYAPLWEQQAARRRSTQRIGESARVEVSVTGPGGEESVYLLSVARRPAGERSPWRVTGLVRAERADA